MASFYSSSCGEADMLPSYPSSELANNRVYVNPPSVSLSYPNFLSAHQLAEPESITSRDEMVFIPPTRMQLVDRQHDMMPRYSDGNTVISDTDMLSKESIPQYHGLSLSLGSQLHSDLNHYTNSSLCSLLGSDMQSELRENALKNVQYLSFDLAGKAAQDSIKYETSSNFHNSMGSNQAPDFTGTFCNSKYLKAAQDLLDELVSVHRSPKLNEKLLDVKRDADSATEPSRDLSPSERHDMQNKLTQLFSMLDEVDRRYKQYWHQMQAVVSSFDMVVGRGSALPYTALALGTISRQFRCLRDAIKKHIQATQRSLGEQDVNSHGLGVLSRLRYVDQHLRQQKAIQQFGIMRQPWRPQRGLPETAVSVLRAWLFEHFLHPYPKDSEKIVLARETGLTRSQVANWFINARVRLWKPMIEEMYKEEFGESETEARSSPQQPTTQEISAYDERDEDFQVSLMSAAPDDNNQMQSNESMPDVTSRAEIDASRARAGLTYENRVFQGMEANFESNKHIANVGGNRTFFHNNSKTADENIMGDQVSLALGLQHSEIDSNGIQSKGNEAASSSSVALDKLEYYYVDPVNNENRFGNTAHLMSDFVA